VAVSVHERVTAATGEMSDAIYAALDAIDAYREVVESVAAQAAGMDEPNVQLGKRMGQFSARARSMVTAIEDSVLTDLNFCTDRLFSVETAERGEFI